MNYLLRILFFSLTFSLGTCGAQTPYRSGAHQLSLLEQEAKKNPEMFHAFIFMKFLQTSAQKASSTDQKKALVSLYKNGKTLFYDGAYAGLREELTRMITKLAAGSASAFFEHIEPIYSCASHMNLSPDERKKLTYTLGLIRTIYNPRKNSIITPSNIIIGVTTLISLSALMTVLLLIRRKLNKICENPTQAKKDFANSLASGIPDTAIAYHVGKNLFSISWWKEFFGNARQHWSAR